MTEKSDDAMRPAARADGVLTTRQGHPVGNNQSQRTVGPRGPATLENYHFLEKISHFDRVRIPERVVHARGFVCYGEFEATGNIGEDLWWGRWQLGPWQLHPLVLLFARYENKGRGADQAELPLWRLASGLLLICAGLGFTAAISIASPLGVTGVRLKNVKDGATREIPADGVFIAIGHAPSSELFKGQLETNSGGYLRVRPGTASTAIEGVWAAGDVTDDVYRQAVTAAGMGCMAALEAARFLAEEDHAKAHHPISHAEAEKIGVW